MLPQYIFIPCSRDSSGDVLKSGYIDGRPNKIDTSTNEIFKCISLFYLFIDIDECAEKDGCCANGNCVNTIGSYKCSCLDGYLLSKDAQTCNGKILRIW